MPGVAQCYRRDSRFNGRETTRALHCCNSLNLRPLPATSAAKILSCLSRCATAGNGFGKRSRLESPQRWLGRFGCCDAQSFGTREIYPIRSHAPSCLRSKYSRCLPRSSTTGRTNSFVASVGIGGSTSRRYSCCPLFSDGRFEPNSPSCDGDYWG